MFSTDPRFLTLPQLLSARKKIGTVAAYFDPEKYSLVRRRFIFFYSMTIFLMKNFLEWLRFCVAFAVRIS
jgi:hypothetical protein